MRDNFSIAQKGGQNPFFMYLAFNAPHAPLQPLKKDYEKYLGRYDEGWDKMRAKRVAKQRELDLFGNDVEPSPRPGQSARTPATASRRSMPRRSSSS